MRNDPLPDRPIPVLRPLLPTASRLLPYLQRIDATRVYANWGPLVLELSDRLCTAFALPPGSVTCANSGMGALMGGILATAGLAKPQRRLALMPDFTFSATGLAAQLCGYEPLLVSSSRQTWTFDPRQLLNRPELLAQVGIVVPVAPFGRLDGLADWEAFRDATGIPVVIDAAACFEVFERGGVPVGAVPMVLSFHATKSFGTGEGGCVLTTDNQLAEKLLQCLNFGFAGTRNTALPSLNGKMAEYAAAVGLAELDSWEDKRKNFERVSGLYRAAFAAKGIANRFWNSPEISSSYVLLECADSRASIALGTALAERGIETRLWYGEGLGGHDAFSDCPRLQLHGSDALDPGTLLGLPSAVDLTEVEIGRIALAVSQSLEPEATVSR